MDSGSHFMLNGEIILTGKLIISADNRSFRFGDGCFETMKMVKGNIALYKYHFERLITSLQLLKFEVPQYFTQEYLLSQIVKIAKKNNHSETARIRLTIFRGNGGLFDYENDFPNCLIQTREVQPSIFSFNKKGLHCGIYTKAAKSCDDFSSIKSNNFLPYSMAAMWATENKLDDALILNSHQRVVETTIANIFLVTGGKVKTPALTEGCISGVMRKFVLGYFFKESIPFEETSISENDLSEAEEIFVTNAFRGIKWMQRCEHYNYKFKFSEYLHREITKQLKNGD